MRSGLTAGLGSQPAKSRLPKVSMTQYGIGTNIAVPYLGLGVPITMGGTPNIGLALIPKGTAPFIVGPVPDSTIIGGNARGIYATDLQIQRSAATQVASGANSFLAGSGCTASGAQSFAGGQGTTASGAYSICFGIGGTSTAWASSAAGEHCNATAYGSFSVGSFNTASATSSIALGSSSSAYRFGMLAHGSGTFATLGDSQRGEFVLRCKTTTNAGVEMYLDTTGPAYLVVQSGKVMAMKINICGIKSDGSSVAHYLRQYAVKNVGGTTTQCYAPITIGSDVPTGTSIVISANNAGSYISIMPTGVSGETWRWTAHVEAVEIAYGT